MKSVIFTRKLSPVRERTTIMIRVKIHDMDPNDEGRYPSSDSALRCLDAARKIMPCHQ